jgi:hypothetical protein
MTVTKNVKNWDIHTQNMNHLVMKQTKQKTAANHIDGCFVDQNKKKEAKKCFVKVIKFL